MMVKVCGVTTIEDAEAAVAAGADALGFNFYPPSPRYVTPGQAAAIASSLPRTVLRVGVFVEESTEAMEHIASVAQLDVAQVHGVVRPDSHRLALRVWRALPVTEDWSAADLGEEHCDAFLLDAPAPGLHGGTGRTFDWSRVTGLSGRLILAGGLGPDNVAAAIAAVRPWGVDACSRLESSPGRKDHDRVRRFVAAARREFAA